MIKNYLKTALRSLAKNKGFTAINVLGLALGLATCLLIVLYVYDELSYDRYNVNADRIYRVNSDIKFGGNASSYAITPPPLAGALMSGFPEVEKAARLYHEAGVRVKKGNENIQEEKVIYSDPGIFDIFTFPAIAGNPAKSLNEPNTVAITESTAKKYFNRTNVVGETLTVNNKLLYKIVAVIHDLPKQSHFNFDLFFSLASKSENKETNWYNYSVNTYILLKKGADYKKLDAKFPAFIKKNSTQQADELGLLKTGNYFRMNLTPLTDIHLLSNREYEIGVNGSLQYVYIFSAIALFILLIACINFMNLATARSANRAREVGVRKVLGSTRTNLILQFLSESIIITLAATLLAVITAWILLPSFNQLSGKSLYFPIHYVPALIGSLLSITLIVGVIAGAYPAFFLSGFNPIHVLKGRLTVLKGVSFRSFLVVFQFAISIFLIIGTIIIYNQLRYIQSKDLGFNRNQVLIIQNTDVLKNAAKILKQQVKQLPGVENATLSNYLPTNGKRDPDVVFTSKVASPKTALMTEIWPVDESYIGTMGMRIIKGRNFIENSLKDSSAIIINEAAVKMLGYENDPLQKKLYTFGVTNKAFNVIGVVKDFNFVSLRSNITPVVMVLGQDNGALSVRVNSANMLALVGKIESKWKTLSADQHFNYSFMNEDFDALYRSEQRMGILFVIFTTLAIVIACLGLFGLAAHAAEQRNKEIGIRKVLGASVATIVSMLSRDFIKLVIIAIAITIPLAWFAMSKWLQDFAYRINIEWWVMAAAAIGAVFIAFATISYQSFKAARANPVESLRSE